MRDIHLHVPLLFSLASGNSTCERYRFLLAADKVERCKKISRRLTSHAAKASRRFVVTSTFTLEHTVL